MTAPTKRAIQAALSFYAGESLPPEESPTAPRRNARPEAAAMAEVLKALHGHPSVAWCERMNSGAHVVEGPTGRLRPEQSIFLERVRAAGGAAFVARNCADVLRSLQGGVTS